MTYTTRPQYRNCVIRFMCVQCTSDYPWTATQVNQAYCEWDSWQQSTFYAKCWILSANWPPFRRIPLTSSKSCSLIEVFLHSASANRASNTAAMRHQHRSPWKEWTYTGRHSKKPAVRQSWATKTAQRMQSFAEADTIWCWWCNSPYRDILGRLCIIA